MIEADKRKAIYLLHEQGMGAREIARRLQIDRKTVRSIIAQQGKMPHTVRKDKKHIDPELLQTLHRECQGYVERIHERLLEEEKIEVGYSTLTRMLREQGITRAPQTRCHQVPDEPGTEMQHDTTLYTIALGGKPCKIVASLIYLRYSKRRYLKFYRGFKRFKMKCFFHEALTFWGYAARQCIIDNTNLARLRGTGHNAVIVPEMVHFASQYGFEFRCHELNHPNRKAGGERSFWTVETNFLTGRTFESLEDLNDQAFSWATERLENRPQGKARLIPAKAFDHEQAYLIELPCHLPAPYQDHKRDTDEYGFIAFEANYYWVPGTKCHAVKVLQYASSIKIYHNRQCLAEYPLPPDGVKNEKFSPEGFPKPPHQPSYRKRPSVEEEKRLRALGPEVVAFLDRVLPLKGQRHHFIRCLLALNRKMTPELFVKSIARANQYRIEDIETIENIAHLYLQEEHLNTGDAPLPAAELDEDLTDRESYQEGFLTESPDLSIYQDSDSDDDSDGDSQTEIDDENEGR